MKLKTNSSGDPFFWLQIQAYSSSLSFKAFNMCAVLSFLVKEVQGEGFSSLRLRSEHPNSSLSRHLPNFRWCYFLHVTREPCSVRHTYLSNKRLWYLIFKCAEISNELLTSKAHPLSPSYFPDWQEQLFVHNSLRH